MVFFIGIFALLLMLAGFSLFSLKFPKGSKAMSGLAPFAFNDPAKVILAMSIAAAGGTIAGLVGAAVFKKLGFGNEVVPD